MHTQKAAAAALDAIDPGSSRPRCRAHGDDEGSLHLDLVKRRPPLSALTRSTDGGSGRVEHGDQSTHRAWRTGRGCSLIGVVSKSRTSRAEKQKIRLSSDGANLLNGSWNGRADGDGCVEFAPDAGVAHGLRV